MNRTAYNYMEMAPECSHQLHLAQVLSHECSVQLHPAQAIAKVCLQSVFSCIWGR